MKQIHQITFISFLSLLTVFPFAVTAQKKVPGKSLVLTAGRATHFTGDVRGLGVQTEYTVSAKKNWFWTAGIGYTIHNDKGLPVIFDYNGRTYDETKNETNAGIQVTGHWGYKLLNQPADLLGVKIGGLLRYQSLSAATSVSILYPALTNLPYPVYVFDNSDPQVTFAAGVSGQLFYTHALSSKLGLGILAGYQFDSNGDNISQISLSITRFLK